MKIVVASKNPVKLEAARSGFLKMFPGEIVEVSGVPAVSNVTDQPRTDTETFTGAKNRADNACAAAPEADFWVGIEGGVEEKGNEMEAFAWVVVHSREGQYGKGRSGTFFLPPRVAALVREGKELGEADDIVFQKTNSKQDNGAVGILTGDAITRAAFYTEIVILALIPFRNKDLYWDS